MPSPSCTRLLVGVATVALAGALSWAPMVASAESTPTPTPAVNAAATPTATPEPAESTPTPAGTESSPAPTESATHTPDDDETAPSISPSPEETEEAPPSGSRDALSRSRVAAGAPAAEEQVQAMQVDEASITLTKTASPTRVSRVGQVVSYSFEATNDGAVALSNVGITDELEGLGPIGCDRAEPVTLQPGDILTCSATLTVTQADLDFGAIYNFASVFGEVAGEEGGPPEDVGAVADAAVQVNQEPSVALTASVTPTGTADRGDRLRYRATATNTGNVTLSAAQITSSLDALDLDCDPSARANLAPGATISCSGSYRVTTADARRGRVTNELTARAERPFGDPDARGDDVTDDVRLRVAVTKFVDAADGGLANTGGPALPLGLAGLLSVAGGVALIRRARRAVGV